MGVGVVADRADRQLARELAAIQGDVATDDEERPSLARLRQLLDRERGVRSRAVVERERELVAAPAGAVDWTTQPDQVLDMGIADRIRPR